MISFFRTPLLLLFTLSIHAGALAGVFGDGDPSNGDEDDRRTLSEGAALPGISEWYRSGGTIFCDGAVRGSATLINMEALTPQRGGALIATAAHVLIDLSTGNPWLQCSYHHQGLGALPGYQVKLQDRFMLKGDFDATDEVGAPASVVGDWAFIWSGMDWHHPVGASGVTLADVREAPDGEGLLGLLAWDPGRGEVTIAAGCRAIFSHREDVSGDANGRQLLDNCDSDTGASGGALILSYGGIDYLVGIRSGHHWDEERWPTAAYPNGPPQGMPWDPLSHTNYARAMDAELLGHVRRWWTNTLPGDAGQPGNPASGAP